MTKLRLIAPAFALSVLAGPSLAQTPIPAPIAPATPTPMMVAPPTTYPMVSIYGGGGELGPGMPLPLRRAAARGDIRDWLPADDPSVVAAQTGERVVGSIRLDLWVSPEGEVAGCKSTNAYGPPILFDGLCDRVSERARLVPAIDESGVPLPEVYSVWISFGRSMTEPSRLVDLRLPPPAPPPPGPQWPPRTDPLLAGVTGLDLMPPGPPGAEANATPWAGVVYNSGTDPRTACRIVKSSGDAAFDAQVCAAAAKGKYDFSAISPPDPRRMQLHFVLFDGRPRALVPVQKSPSGPKPGPVAQENIARKLGARPAEAVKALRLNLTVDAAGTVYTCAVETSSGSDAIDVEACTTVRRAGTFIPARDIFGRPSKGFLYRWNPLERP